METTEKINSSEIFAALTVKITRTNKNLFLNIEKSRMKHDERYWVLVLEPHNEPDEKSRIRVLLLDTEDPEMYFIQVYSEENKVTGVYKVDNVDAFVIEAYFSVVCTKGLYLVVPEVETMELHGLKQEFEKSKNLISVIMSEEQDALCVQSAYEGENCSNLDIYSLNFKAVQKNKKVTLELTANSSLTDCTHMKLWNKPGDIYALIVDKGHSSVSCEFVHRGKDIKDKGGSSTFLDTGDTFSTFAIITSKIHPGKEAGTAYDRNEVQVLFGMDTDQDDDTFKFYDGDNEDVTHLSKKFKISGLSVWI